MKQSSGRRSSGAPTGRLRPALLSGYEEVTKLRYDYPLVLTNGEDGNFVRSLSGAINDVLREIAPRGAAGERIRKHVLRLEEQIRVLASRDGGGLLSEYWHRSREILLSDRDGDDRESMRDSIALAEEHLGFDGEVVDCALGTPVTLLSHAWAIAQRQHCRRYRRKIDGLAAKLSAILRADFLKSGDARTSDFLSSSVSTAHREAFDFAAWSRLLGATADAKPMKKKRRTRIQALLSILASQKFFAPRDEIIAGVDADGFHDFSFDSCVKAKKAFRDRLGEMAEIVKAAAIAELEIENAYRGATHDPLFAAFDESSMTAEDLAGFPFYFVHIGDKRFGDREKAAFFDILSADAPIKVLFQCDDILSDLFAAADGAGFGVDGSRLAAMTIGLGGAFVLQAGSANLFKMKDRIMSGMATPGPALFSIYSGANGHMQGVPPYLVSAAAVESRAFPIFAHDPGAGKDWASRFHIDGNPQPEARWAVHHFDCEDQDHQNISEDLVFTFADFAACDDRCAKYFLGAPPEGAQVPMTRLADHLADDAAREQESVPYISLLDDNNGLHRIAVDARLVRAARRAAETWRGLQELGGIDNSHARILVAKERENWERERIAESPAAAPEEDSGPATPAPEGESATGEAELALADATEAAEETPPGEPYIETPRCTTCNECTDINARMFVYNDNMQAYIADPDAGTFRELVEAAETCQVCIIHPGLPRNQSEPNLEELGARAEPFN